MSNIRSLAVDFDGTLCEEKFPEIGEIKPEHQTIINYIRAQHAVGVKIVLWTCREDLPERKYLTEAVDFCKKHDIPIDFVNEYENPDFPGQKGRKPSVDVFIDDRAICPSMISNEYNRLLETAYKNERRR